jgi:hypothetical protein
LPLFRFTRIGEKAGKFVNQHSPLSPMMRAAKLLIAVAMLMIPAVGPAQAGHDGRGWGGGWHGGGGWHEAGGWNGGWPHAGGRHDHGWRGGFAAARFEHGWRGARFVVPVKGGWDWRRAWGWSHFGWGWGVGAWAWGGLAAGVSFGVIVAPPPIVLPPPIYVAPPPIVLGLPAITPPPIAAAPAPPVAAPSARATPRPSVGTILGATVPPPIVVLPPPPIVVAAAAPLVVFTPPAFGLFIGPPVLAFATIGPGWWHGGFITGGFGTVGLRAGIAHFGGREFARAHFGLGRSHWAWGGGWHGGGFGRRGGGGWHEARISGGGFGGGHGRWR